ncbi:MAG: glycosyltransferase [Prevotella sp.]|nr:glycosyltransferase [Prevotella sp.]
MIFVRDRGRMCNNILQYGHVYAWGREHGRKTVSMRFAYKYRYFHICDTPWHNFLTYVFAKYAAKWKLIPTISFDKAGADYQHEEQLMLEKKLAVVEGWEARWYELFVKYKDEIRQLFAFHERIEQQVARKMATDEETTLRLGLHIRRGDYQRWYGGRFFYSDEQYAHLIAQFCSLHPDKRVMVYICGNDPKIDKAYYQRQLPQCQVSFPDGNPGEDLCLLSHCDYLIGAPSTFTLVAAMYRDLPLYWIEDAQAALTPDSFRRFDYLFRHLY